MPPTLAAQLQEESLFEKTLRRSARTTVALIWVVSLHRVVQYQRLAKRDGCTTGKTREHHGFSPCDLFNGAIVASAAVSRYLVLRAGVHMSPLVMAYYNH